jgi:hypothetical protein
MHYIVYLSKIISKYNIYYFLQKDNKRKKKEKREKEEEEKTEKNPEIYLNICFRMVIHKIISPSSISYRIFQQIVFHQNVALRNVWELYFNFSIHLYLYREHRGILCPKSLPG